MNEIQFNEQMAQLSHRHAERLNELKVTLQKDGLYATRCSLNQSRNFQRDYLPLMQKTAWAIQPIEVLKRDLMTFFNKIEEGK